MVLEMVSIYQGTQPEEQLGMAWGSCIYLVGAMREVHANYIETGCQSVSFCFSFRVFHTANPFGAW
jgi:hypothetical protein